MLYDPQPFHLDKEAAAEGPFNGLIASGFQTLAVAFRIFYQANVINACSMASPGLDELRWLRPVRPGDTLKVTATVREKTPPKSQPDPRKSGRASCRARVCLTLFIMVFAVLFTRTMHT